VAGRLVPIVVIVIEQVITFEPFINIASHVSFTKRYIESDSYFHDHSCHDPDVRAKTCLLFTFCNRCSTISIKIHRVSNISQNK